MAATNEELIRKYRQTGEQRYLDRLVLNNLGLAVHIFFKKYRWLNLPRDEIRSVGTISILNAANAFDLDHGSSFSGYAGMAIERDFQAIAVSRFFNTPIGSGQVHKKVMYSLPRRWRGYVDAGMSIDEGFEKACADVRVSQNLAIEILNAAGAPAPVEINETSAIVRSDYSDQEATARIIGECITAALFSRDAEIVRRCYLGGEKAKAVAADVGLTSARISQILQEALPKLAREMKRRGLSMDDFDLH